MVGTLGRCRSRRSVAGLIPEGRCATCRISAWPVVGRQAVAALALQRRDQLASSDKVGIWLAAMGRGGCRFSYSVFTATQQPHRCCLGVNDVQTRSRRLRPGLTASAQYHQPRGLLHPHVLERLDIGCADDIFEPSFSRASPSTSRSFQVCAPLMPCSHGAPRALIRARARPRRGSSLPVRCGCKSRRRGGAQRPLRGSVPRLCVCDARAAQGGGCREGRFFELAFFAGEGCSKIIYMLRSRLCGPFFCELAPLPPRTFQI